MVEKDREYFINKEALVETLARCKLEFATKEDVEEIKGMIGELNTLLENALNGEIT